MLGMSLRAFARRRGISLAAVQRAIADARLTSASVGQDAKGRPVIHDPAQASREWAAHSRPRLANVAPGPGRVSALGLATLRERQARAERLEFELALRRGAVVSAAAVEQAWAALVVNARNALLAIPSRLKGRAPHLQPSDCATLDALIREVLGELAAEPRPRDGSPNGHPPRTHSTEDPP